MVRVSPSSNRTVLRSLRCDRRRHQRQTKSVTEMMGYRLTVRAMTAEPAARPAQRETVLTVGIN